MARPTLLLAIPRHARSLLAAAILLGVATGSGGCATAPARPESPLRGGIHYAHLTRFASISEFDGYLAQVAEAQKRRQSRARRSYGVPSDALASPSAAPAPQAAPAAEASARSRSPTTRSPASTRGTSSRRRATSS